MNMEQKSLGKLISFYISVSTVIYSFYSKIDVDKYVGYFVVTVAFLLMLNFKNFQKIFINTLNRNLFIIGICSLTAVYLHQLIKYKIIFNVEVFTILSIYTVIILYNLTKNKFDYFSFLKMYGAIVFFFLIIDIVNFKGMSITIKQQGLSSFICFLTFVIFYFFYKNNYFLQIFAGLFILITQTRVLILSLFLILFRSNLSNFKNIIKGLIIFSFIILFIYIFFPQSRIFQTHTSGRLIHWEIIYLSFDFNNIFTGMGAGSSFEFLRNFGISHSMGRAHNEFLTYSYELGIFGLISLLCVLKLIHSLTSNQGKIIFYTILLQMLTDNILTYYFNYLLPLILCLLTENDMHLIKKDSTNVSKKDN